MADRLAKEAVTATENIQPIHLLSDIKNIIKSKTIHLWQTMWTEEESKLKNIKPIVNQKLPLPFKRREQVILSRLRIGHSKLTHEHLLKKTPPPMCDVCENIPITVTHILTCKKYENARRKHKVANTASQALGYNIEAIGQTLAFITDIGLNCLI